MNCSDHYGEDWGDVTGAKLEAMEESMWLTPGMCRVARMVMDEQICSRPDGDDAA